MSGPYDALVIGGDAGGLAAATYLATAGLRTLLLEKGDAIVATGEPVLFALDPRVVKDLKLGRHGLKFAFRDLSLVTLRTGAPPLTVPRDSRHAARGLAAASAADAQALPHYLNALFAVARALRPCWWDGQAAARTVETLRPALRSLAERLTVTSALAFASSWFETDLLKAAVAFDATRAGFAPTEPGSALALAWSAAQEMCGMQGASALPLGGQGGLVRALALAAQTAGVEIRTGATVASLVVAADRIGGVELAAGERIDAPLVLSTLSRRATLALAPTAAFGLGVAQAQAAPTPVGVSLVFGLNRHADADSTPLLPGSRYIVAERPEAYAAALGATRLGELPDEPMLELTVPPPDHSVEALASRTLLHVRAWPIPPDALSDRDAIARLVTAAVERLMPGFGGRIASCDVLPACRNGRPSVARLLSSAAERIGTGIPGLLLCGPSAEPAGAVSCRAARQAARLGIALRERKEPR